ncbi:TIGR04206 family protein [Halobacterium bonnevillei]|uniref:TIGR04206 family protein n=1 Tax=Halobacterium bonnevillei TaxID=2692200 RepID=A0A6B0SMD9_9EURY|nr:TIGR04206 family protein [Halobacterium bonnevillei]MXR20683.1 TIGR04206 family protein [Halobacterium bonnevillei]
MTRRRLAVAVLAGLLPWVVVTFDGGFYTMFAGGFLHLDPFSFTSMLEYLGRVPTVPARLTAWPTATLLYALGLAAAVLNHVSGFDARVPAGLLFLAGVDVGLLGVSLSGQQGILAVPVGAVWLWAAVWVGYGDELLPSRA